MEEVVVLSDGDSDNDVSFIGASSKALRTSTSPVFLRASRSAEVYSLVDIDGESDDDDLYSVLAGTSITTRCERNASTTILHDSTTTSTLLHTHTHCSSTTGSSATSRRHQSVSASRSILSVLEGDWGNEPALVASTAAADPTRPHKRRRKIAKVRPSPIWLH